MTEFAKLATEFRELTEREVLYRGKYARARAYGEGDRPGHSLASLVCPPWSANNVLQWIRSLGTLLLVLRIS